MDDETIRAAGCQAMFASIAAAFAVKASYSKGLIPATDMQTIHDVLAGLECGAPGFERWRHTIRDILPDMPEQAD